MADEKMEKMEKPKMEMKDDSNIWSALCYVFPILGFILVFVTDKKENKTVLFHAWQSLILGIGYFIASMIITTVTFGLGGLCMPFGWLVFLYFAYKAYTGDKLELPTVSELARKQIK